MKWVVRKIVLPWVEQLPQPLPDDVPRLRIEAGRRLVQENEIGVVDERARERQPALHAARQRLDARIARAPEAGELEQPRNAGADFRVGQAEIAAVDEQILLAR